MTEVDVCRHCGREDVMVSVLIPAHLSHTGKVRRENKPIDACIADLVRRLNAEGDEPVTCGSCCGHGEGPGVISLADGRELQISMSADPTAKDRERARAWAETFQPTPGQNTYTSSRKKWARGHAQGQADERARIVAAMRERAELGWSGEDHWSDWDLLEGAADDIERGEL